MEWVHFLWWTPSILFNYITGTHRRNKMIQLTPIDRDHELNGVEAVYRGATLIIARSGNTRFKRIFKQLLKPYKHQLDKGTLDDTVSEELLVSAYAEAILVGWKEFKDVNGKSHKYTKANAIDLLSSDQDCFEFVRSTSEDINRYIIEDEEETKNE